MELLTFKVTNPVTRHNINVRESMPQGVGKHRVNKPGLWRKTKPRRPAAVCFDLKGMCQGDMHDVITLGMKLAREAIDRGDKEYAEAIIRRIKKLPREYELRELLEKKERLLQQLRRSK